MGIITALGFNIEEHLQSIVSEKHALSYPEILNTIHKTDLVVGEIKRSNEWFIHELNLQHGKGYSRTALLGIYALRECLKDFSGADLGNDRVAFINSTTVGGMSNVEDLYFDMISESVSGNFTNYVDALDCADCTHRIADYFGIKGFITTISTACSSSANAIQMGARLIAQGEVDIAICGGTDALTRFTINGFNSLKNVDKYPSQPFDENRRGLNLGEGAAYLVLESETSARKRNASILAKLAGYGNTNEAHHPTAPSPDGVGALRTMQLALAYAGINARQIDYINAHGTATLGNDLSEGMALQRLFGEDCPPYSSTKSFTGHTLAASGGVEAIMCILAMQHSFVPANLRLQTPMKELLVGPAASTILNRQLNYTLSNSFGFGGNNVSLIFSKE